MGDTNRQDDSGALRDWDNTKPNTEQGIYRKYEVRRTDGRDASGWKHYGCEYFVLDVTHDKHAAAALAAYADSVAATHPHLAADMRERYALSPQGSEPAGVAHPDTARLNWLEHMARHGGLFLYNGVDVERERASAPGLGLRPSKVDRNLREAIDQASSHP